MTLKASDLPGDGSSKLVLVDGALFEVARERSTMDGRRSVYKARQVPNTGELSTSGGYWYRFTWKLMLADLRFMAKAESGDSRSSGGAAQQRRLEDEE